jgi:ABC-2 type transport system permease protein
MLARVLNVIRKEFIQLRRDRLLAPFIILGPLAELIAVAYSTSQPIEHIPTAIVDLDRSQRSRELVAAFGNSQTFDPTYYLYDQTEVRTLIDNGTSPVAIVIPQGFSQGLSSGVKSQLQVILDGSEPSVAQTAELAAQGVVAHYSAQLMREEWGASQVATIDYRARVWFNEELSEANYTVPAELAFMLYMVALMVASLGIARERELGTLEQLMVSPLRPIELVIGKATLAVVISYLDFLLMLSVTLFIFHVPLKGSLPLLLTISLLYIFVELGWGIMISTISSSQQQALLLVFILGMTEMVFSGYAIPIESMPRVLQLLSNLVAIKHFLIIFRGILLKGAGLSAFIREIAALVIIGSAVMALTFWTFKKRLD